MQYRRYRWYRISTAMTYKNIEISSTDGTACITVDIAEVTVSIPVLVLDMNVFNCDVGVSIESHVLMARAVPKNGTAQVETSVPMQGLDPRAAPKRNPCRIQRNIIHIVIIVYNLGVAQDSPRHGAAVQTLHGDTSFYPRHNHWVRRWVFFWGGVRHRPITCV